MMQLYEVVEEDDIKRETSDFTKFMQYLVKKLILLWHNLNQE